MSIRRIKFSEDYEKLPPNWPESRCRLIAVHPISIAEFKEKFGSFLYNDTKIREEDRHYPLNFQEGLLLVFLHENSGRLIPTIRRDYPEKRKYYVDCIGDTFILTDTRKKKE